MTNRFSRRAIACALLTTTALSFPSIVHADAPAPTFIDAVDGSGVDLATGLPTFSMEEGGIGSGPGRVSLKRIWAEGAGLQDNWSGGMYTLSSGSTTKTYVEIGGISETFSPSGSNYVSDKADGATLVTQSDGTTLFTARDGSTILFSSTENVGTSCPGSSGGSVCFAPLTIKNPSGLKFTLTWETSTACMGWWSPGNCLAPVTVQRLKTIQSSAGYSANITYVTNDAGYLSGYTGIDPNYLNRSTVTFGNSANPPSPVPTSTYAYPSSTETDVTDPAGRTWKFFTDSNNRLTGIQRPGSSSTNVSYAYGADGTVSSSTKDGVTNTYSRSVVGSTATETLTNPLSQQTVITSDTNLGRPTSYKDALNRTTSQTYDTNARLTKVTAPEGNYVQFAYDARGNVTTTTSAAKSGSGLSNIVTSTSFDSTCTNVVKCNEPNSTTDAKGNVTNYTYDATHGGVLTVTLPAPTTGAVQPQTRYSYTRVTSASGDLVYVLTGVSACQTTSSCTGAADETKATIAYNSNLLPTSVTRGDGTGALAATTAYTYDSHGNVSTVDGPLAGTADTTKYRYDTADQLIGVTSPNPGNGQPDRATRITYRPDGQVSKKEIGTVTDQSDTAWANFATAQQIDITFDANSRPITSKLSASGTPYALTQTSYDADGRPQCTAVRMNTAVYGSLPASACTLGTQGSYGPDQISQVIYDNAGQVTQDQVAVGTSVAANERTLTYTNNGRLQTLTDGENNKTTYVYDGFDRLSQTQYPSPTKGAGTSNTSDYEQLSYDTGSNVTSRRLRDGTSIGYSFDNLNRVTLKTLPNSEAAVNYSYDNLNRVTALTQTGYSMSFGYDALSRQTAENQGFGSITRQFDLAGNLTRTTWWDGFYVTYDHLVTGDVSAIRENGATSGVGVLASYAYDNLGNRTSVTFGNGANQVYTYDPVARLASLTNNLAGTTNNLSATFGYSPASQIASTARTGDAYAFGGDYNVNRGYTSNGINQYSVAGPASFAYDAKGNLTSDGTNSYTYWTENMLKSAPGATLYYDQLHRLVEYDTSVSTRFVYDGANMAAEVNNPAGAIQKRYVFGPSGEPVVEYSGSGTTNRQFVSTDERGSVISLSDSSGNLIGINSYDEYGIPASTNQGRFGYTGQAWLSEIGLQYSRARIYSPTLGRFLQTDPLGYGDGPNWYAYAHSDPVNGADPSGLDDKNSPPHAGGICTGTRIEGNCTTSGIVGGESGYSDYFGDRGLNHDGSGNAISPGIGPGSSGTYVGGVWNGVSTSISGTSPYASNAAGLINQYGGYYLNGVWNSTASPQIFWLTDSGLGTVKNWINTPPQFFEHVSARHFGADTNVASKFVSNFQNPVSLFRLAQFAANFGQQRPSNYPGVFMWTAKYSGLVGFLYGTGDPTNYVTLVAQRLGTLDPEGRPEYRGITLYPGW